MPSLPSPALARSYLYAPGNVDRLLHKVFNAGADAVVLDLEDSVPPQNKLEARRMVAGVLKERENQSHPRIYVRINSLSTEFWHEDIEAILQPALHGIRVPKVESQEQIEALDGVLADLEERAGLDRGAIRVTPAVESAAGVLAAADIVKHPRVESLGGGGLDLLRDIGVEPDPSGLSTLYAHSYMVLVSRAAGLIPPVASVYPRVTDLGGLRATTEAANRLGFFGRSCIHPAQIPVVHHVFTPSPDQVARARAIVEAFNRKAAEGIGAFVMEDGEFVDKAVATRAEALVGLADSLTPR